MKKQGIKPKPAKGVIQRFLNGESFQDYFDKEILKEARSHKPVIVVDVQPCYGKWIGRDKIKNIIDFVNRQTGPILFLANAEETGVTDDSISDIKYWWEENGYMGDWSNVQIIDKGYGYLRPWMDNNVSESSIIKAIRTMYGNRWTDSREIADWNDDDTVSAEKWQELLQDETIPDDSISVDWLSVKKLKQHENGYLVGGGENECLKEVQLLMNTFNIHYTKIKSLIY
jgi:hypothetical protein